MKKNYGMLLLFLLIGMLTGSLLSLALKEVQAISFLTKSTLLTWEPSADLDVLKYDFKIQVKLSLLSVAGLIAAFWLYRRL